MNQASASPVRQNIVLLCGGHSNEYDVSLLSAREVAQNIDAAKYRLFIILIPQKDSWRLVTPSQLGQLITGGSKVNISKLPNAQLTYSGTKQLLSDNGEPIADNVRAVIPMLHGAYGEDGAIQAMLDIGGYNYVGPGSYGSNNGFDKIRCKRILEEGGLPVVPYIAVESTSQPPTFNQACKTLRTIQLVVKPSRSGSSVGVKLVRTANQYAQAIKEAQLIDKNILIEKKIDNLRELELAVKTNQGGVQVTRPGELLNKGRIYGYEEKYLVPNEVTIQIPAKVTPSISKLLQVYAKQAGQLLDCSEMCRVDCFYDGSRLYVNEVNTNPGFTKSSMYPMLWDNEGTSIQNLLNQLIENSSHQSRKKGLSMEVIVTKILKQLSKLYLRRHHPKVIGVAGSVGKTSTKRHIAAVLSSAFRVQHNPGSYNTEIGFPLSVLQEEAPSLVKNPLSWLAIMARAVIKIIGPSRYDVLIAEFGVDQPGDMTKLLSIVQPDIAVLTAISPEHMELLGNMETVANEELQIASQAQLTVVNQDDVLEKWHSRITGPVKTYGRQNFKLTFDKEYRATLSLKTDKNTYSVEAFSNVGENTGLGLVAAIVVAEAMAMTPKQTQAGLAKVQPVPGRMRLLDGLNDSKIIDDSYNSSPLAVVAALKTLRTMPAKRRIALLGGMNEMGEYAEQAYKEALVDVSKIDEFVTLGAQANELFVKELTAKGVKKSQIHSFDDPQKAGEFIRLKLQPQKGDVVLVKGSQNGVYSEEAVKQLLSHSEDARLLVRQSDFWMQKKRQNFNW